MTESSLPTILFGQWLLQNSGTNTQLFSVSFADMRTGYAVGLYKTILKTTNGGLNWVLLSRDTTSFNQLYGIDFVNADTGTAVGQNRILRTADGGSNWVQQSPPYGGYGVSFLGPNTGLIASSGGIVRTTNGGESWTYIFVASVPLNGVQLLDSNLAFAAGGNLQFNQNIYRSTNGGLNWQAVGGGIGEDLYGVSFANTLTGLVVGRFRTIYRTTNGGNSWMLRGRELPGGNFRSVSMSDKNNATAVGEGGVIARTTDGGFTWSLQQNPTTSHLYGVVMVDSLNAWAVGANGTILHTTNGGVTSAATQRNGTPKDYYLEQNYPNPFNPNTIINYELSIDNLQLVTLKVFDVLGREVATLVNEVKEGGGHSVVFHAGDLASGVYYYRLSTSGVVRTRKMLLIH
jgi:photosystem II stability/assembly factor-like uncharacterized protein